MIGWQNVRRCTIPHYDYECEECGYEFEAFHSMTSKPLKDCPECGEPKLIKLIGSGAAVIIKDTDNPCRGTRKIRKPNLGDKLGEGKNKTKNPFWRDGKIDKTILKNPEGYIREGKV